MISLAPWTIKTMVEGAAVWQLASVREIKQFDVMNRIAMFLHSFMVSGRILNTKKRLNSRQ